MNIVYLSNSGQLGGAERSLLDFLASTRIHNPRLSLHLIAPAEGPLVSEASALGVRTAVLMLPKSIARLGDAAAGGPAGKHTRLPTLLSRSCRSLPDVIEHVRKLRQVLAEIAPTLIHAHGFKMNILGMWAKPASVPLVWHLHDYLSSRPIMARLMRIHSKRCALAIANSNSTARDAREVCGDRLKIQTVYNAVDLERFSVDGASTDLDEAAGVAHVSNRTVRVGLVATMARWKGLCIRPTAVSSPSNIWSGLQRV